MTGKTWLLACVAAILTSGSGCVCCGSDSFAAAHEMGAQFDIPTCQRNHVYVFAVGGMNPINMMALDSLREELSHQGFAKVATGQTIHTVWMAQQIRDIRGHEPDAVFVILGSDSGASAAVRLAERVQARGIPVAAVVLLDVEGKIQPPSTSVRTLVLGGEAGRFTTTASPQDVAAVTQLLNEVAASTPQPAVEHVAAWWYPEAPPARPFVELGTDRSWAFLFDQPGVVPAAIEDGEPTIVGRRPPSPYISAVR